MRLVLAYPAFALMMVRSAHYISAIPPGAA